MGHFSRGRMWPHRLQRGAARSCCSWRGMFDFPAAQLFWKNSMNMTHSHQRVRKSCLIAGLPNSFGSSCSWLPVVHSITTKFIYVGMRNYSFFFCYNSSLGLKSVHVINHVHFSALIRTHLKSFTVFCYQ